MPSAWEPRLERCIASLDGNRNFAAENFHTISTDTHIDNMVITPTVLPVIVPGRANKNAAGSVHFETLLDQNPLAAWSQVAGRCPPRCELRGKKRQWDAGRASHCWESLSMLRHRAGKESSAGLLPMSAAASTTTATVRRAAAAVRRSAAGRRMAAAVTWG